MSTQHWWAFTIATFLICFSPGPNMLHMMTSSAHYGFRRTLFSMLGCFIAVSGMIGISVAGVGTLLATSPFLFNVLRYAGAAYLCYLGIQSWRHAHVNIDAPQVAAISSGMDSKQLLRNGFLVGISNPKALLFAGAFFPQFIDPHSPELPQLVILFVTFSVLEFTCYSLYALGGRQLAGLLKHSSVRRAFNRVVGTLFILFSVLLIAK